MGPLGRSIICLPHTVSSSPRTVSACRTQSMALLCCFTARALRAARPIQSAVCGAEERAIGLRERPIGPIGRPFHWPKLAAICPARCPPASRALVARASRHSSSSASRAVSGTRDWPPAQSGTRKGDFHELGDSKTQYSVWGGRLSRATLALASRRAASSRPRARSCRRPSRARTS